MPAYVIATIEMHDAAAYTEQYVPKAGATVLASGGSLLAASDACQIVEGEVFSARNVILGFADMAAAVAWYRSPEYQEVLPFRLASSSGSLMVIEGTDEPYRPGDSYAIATMEVIDPDPYANDYAPTAIRTMTENGGRPLVRGGAHELLEGDAFGPRTVMLAFPSFEAATTWYHLPEYQEVVPIRQGATKDNGLVLVPGLG